jgi:hypothetical protein
LNFNRLHTSLRKDFRDLPSPTSLDDFEGVYSSRYVGPAPVRISGPYFLALLGFGGWKGKRLAKSGEELKGTNRFASGEPRDDRFPMEAQIAPSIIDGRDALVILYPADTAKPWRYARDEFREFEDGKLLGITTFDIPLIKHFPLAFVIERD